ncbi:bifunctional riboflavin kinase/FAD synthetase [Hazenella sp. IB182357]|uniref:Riboflavin biosynthesis protein n=1 Tax=Polycladospora coralii TaxID=2771432 RepID=A0A926NBE8_9BACL|nr:bifunctional riboflavin kinase/FAD synthetase [Polycladospora coralii]MBD1373477.1 bifunctional riboflavin kinase/FAD synthetase [Polycladospora coralii]
MEVIHLSYPLQDQLVAEIHPPTVTAIGNFDGVHKGHQAVIGAAKQLANEINAVHAVMSFTPHPRSVLKKQDDFTYLTPLPEKLTQFESLGVERAYIMKFDPSLAQLSKEDFVRSVLIPLGFKGITVGFNFTFGIKASGKPSDLAQLGEGYYTTRVVNPVQNNQYTFSSTQLRLSLAEGKMDHASQILGRNYQIAGRVVQGDQRGRLMGFPTANIALQEPYLIPRYGVYIVKVHGPFKAGYCYGIMNIGLRPTFNDPIPREQLEVHLFEFSGDLYGQELRVQFLHFLRAELKFDSVHALKQQIHSDQKEAMDWLLIHEN